MTENDMTSPLPHALAPGEVQELLGRKSSLGLGCEDALRACATWGVEAEAEIVRLKAQVASLQGRMTEMVESSQRRRVHAFMGMVGQALPTCPEVPSDEVVRMRLRLVAEEFFELLDSALVGWRGVQTPRHVSERIERGKVSVDLPEFIDALADLDYVVEGTRLAFGVLGEPIAAEVHASNMDKMAGPLRADGKKEKPEGWTPPDIRRLLIAQGWTP